MEDYEFFIDEKEIEYLSKQIMKKYPILPINSEWNIARFVLSLGYKRQLKKKKEGSFKMKTQVEFIAPDQLKDNALSKYTEYLKILHNKIGFEQLTSRLEILSLTWAQENGYYMEKKENKLIFKHVSI